MGPKGPFLVFDVGGTLLRAALFEDGHLLSRAESLSASARGDGSDPVTTLVERMKSLADDVVEGRRAPIAVGVAFPGPVDTHDRVHEAPTLWGAQLPEPVELGRWVSRTVGGLPVTVVNDLTAAGYRYAERHRDFCLVTVSTGIGNKVFLGGEPVLGEQHRGGEIGHWRVDDDPDAPTCDCGGVGHLGAVASGRATPHLFARASRAHPSLLTTSPLGRSPATPSNEAVADAFRSGDAFARELVAIGANALGSALALVHTAIGLEHFIVTGGFARALGPDYLVLLRAAAAQHAWGDRDAWSERIEPGADDDDSGLLGLGRMLAGR